jgi:hypothetical protein
LSYLLKEKDNFFVIWTLRSDFVKEFQNDKAAVIFHRFETIESLSPVAKEGIVSIIKEPAKIASITVEDKLVERLKEDMKDSEALPLLALMLNKLYVRYAEDKKELTLRDYESFGSASKNPLKNRTPLENIIQVIADEAIEKFKDNKKTIEALKKSFIPHLVRINENQEYIKKEANFQELPKEANEVIESLVNARLLIKKQDTDGQTIIEISHEALIQKWGFLQKWIEDEKEFLITKSRV